MERSSCRCTDLQGGRGGRQGREQKEEGKRHLPHTCKYTNYTEGGEEKLSNQWSLGQCTTMESAKPVQRKRERERR